MILTYKIKHGADLSLDLEKAYKVAKFAVVNKGVFSSAAVSHLGLKSVISNQILRKYGRNRDCKRVTSVKMPVPAQGIKYNEDEQQLRIPSLDLSLSVANLPPFQKINQVEVGPVYAYVAVTVPEQSQMPVDEWVGVDLNTTGHCCVVANPSTGKVLKLGKKAHHTHTKYKNQRKRFQRKEKLKLAKQTKTRESRIVRDLNHKISRKVVDYALKNKAGIVLEDLTGIRKTKKQAKSFKYALHSWSFFQLQSFLEYKAKLLGVPVVKIDPAYTSQQCSRCGLLGNRSKKQFKCPACGHVENADCNASFTIALRHQGVIRLPAERDAGKGSTDTPEEATARR